MVNAMLMTARGRIRTYVFRRGCTCADAEAVVVEAEAAAAATAAAVGAAGVAGSLPAAAANWGVARVVEKCLELGTRAGRMGVAGDGLGRGDVAAAADAFCVPAAVFWELLARNREPEWFEK